MRPCDGRGELIVGAEFYNTQIDEMPLNVA